MDSNHKRSVLTLFSYCNSIVQALYHSPQFRENILKYTPFPSSLSSKHAKVNVQIRPPAAPENPAGSGTKQEALKRRQVMNGATILGAPQKPEDNPDSPEYKKKMALLKGPVLELTEERPSAYGMDECTFTGLKDIFTAMIESNSRTGIVSPSRFLDIFKQRNEAFRTSMHQDAHEFYGLLLNDVINTIEAYSAQAQENGMELVTGSEQGEAQETAVEKEEQKTTDKQNGEKAISNGLIVNLQQAIRPQSLSAGWVHEIFEGLITSETKCLACETTSQRDEKFLDLSIDLEEHSSVTSCLKSFSAEEMLCERNKFQCDTCGGLQEAEKRMKIKRLPKVLALHLKRFKYTEDYSRLQKLFHRVVYPYYLRVFNTTDDVEDPDRLYELYGVVVHIGGNAYHGHYVSVIKTQDRGWLLFDDEMVEPVDKHFVKNFFGDKPGTACAYLLLYRETTFEKTLADQEAEGYLDVNVDEENRLSVGEIHGIENGVAVGPGKPISAVNLLSEENTMDQSATVKLEHAKTAPGETSTNGHVVNPPEPLGEVPPPIKRADTTAKSKSELKKEAKAQEKARKQAEKEREKAEAQKRKEAFNQIRESRKAEADDLEKAIQLSLSEPQPNEEHPRPGEIQHTSTGFLGLKNRSSKTVSKSFGFLGKDKQREKKEDGTTNGVIIESRTTNGERAVSSPHQFDKLKDRFSFNLGRKKSSPVLG